MSICVRLILFLTDTGCMKAMWDQIMHIFSLRQTSCQMSNITTATTNVTFTFGRLGSLFQILSGLRSIYANIKRECVVIWIVGMLRFGLRKKKTGRL